MCSQREGARPMPDFQVTNHGSVVSFAPLTDAAQSFLDDDVCAEPWQYMGSSLCVDHRCAEPLLIGITEAGLAVDLG